MEQQPNNLTPFFDEQVMERVQRLEIDLRVVAERVQRLGDIALEFVNAMKRLQNSEAADALSARTAKPRVWLTLTEAADYLRLSTTSLRRLHNLRRFNYFPSCVRNRLIRVRREDLDKWLMSGENRVRRRRPD